MPGDLEARIEAFVEHDNRRRHHAYTTPGDTTSRASPVGRDAMFQHGSG